MRNILKLAILLLFVVSCKSNTEKYLPEVKGNPYEVVLIADKGMETGAAYDTLKAVLSQDVEMINQLEPLYDIVTTTTDNFRNILQQHRNVLIVDIDTTKDSSSIVVERDKYADGQLLITLSGANNDQLASYIEQHKDELIKFLDITEQQRMVKKIETRTVSAINDSIKQMFNIDIKIPSGYKIRNIIDDNFIWLSYEAPLSSQGIFIYSYPFESGEQFTQQLSLAMRNKFAALIPGPSDDSFMSTSEVFPPVIRKVSINKREWVEQRGFWNVKNDFMGGPFISFSAQDKENNRIIVVDEYLYSPKNEKPMRNLLRQLENVVYTVKF